MKHLGQSLSAYLLLAAMAPAAQAQIATHVRTFDPPGNPQLLSAGVDGSIMVSELDNVVVKYSSSWSTLLELLDSKGRSGPREFVDAEGAVLLHDGRAVVVDAGGVWEGETFQSRFAVFSAEGELLEYWLRPGGTIMSGPRLAPNGDFFLARQNSGTTTIERWSPTGQQVLAWSVSTTALELDVRDGVVYLGGEERRIYKFSLEGAPLGTVPHTNVGHVVAIAVDGAGRIYQATTSVDQNYLVLLAPNGSRLGIQRSTELGNWGQAVDMLLVDDQRLFLADWTAGGGPVHELAVTSEPPTPAHESSWGRLKALYR